MNFKKQNLPLNYFEVSVIFLEGFLHKQLVIMLNQPFDGADCRFANYFLQKLKHFPLISCSNHQTEENKAHQQKPGKVSAWTHHLRDAEENSKHVQTRRCHVSTHHEYFDFRWCKLQHCDSPEGCGKSDKNPNPSLFIERQFQFVKAVEFFSHRYCDTNF